MNLSNFVVACTLLIGLASAAIDPKNLKCLVCRQIFDELNEEILKIDKWKKVDVGNFRMDENGNTMQDKIPAHRSSVYISEMIDDICKKMDDYVRVHYKATGKLALIHLLMKDGTMNPLSSITRFVTDDDLNKSLEYYCERMFEENEDEITDLYKNRPEDEVMPDAERAICFDQTKYCEDWMIPTEEDKHWTPEMEAEYNKVHGGDPYGFGRFTPPTPDLGSALDDEELPEDELPEDELPENKDEL